MILDVYFGEQLVQNQNVSQNFFYTIVNSTLFYFLIIFVFFYLIFLILFFVRPLLKKDPKVYYARYLKVRSEMQKIDALYKNRDIDFEDYVFAQFNYAKEYEQIVTFLAKIPEYKKKLVSYKIEYTKEQELNNFKTDDSNDKTNKDVEFLYDILYPKVKYYTVEELMQAILDEGFDRSIALNVIKKFYNAGVVFNTAKKKEDTSKVINFINSLVGTEAKLPDKFTADSSINIKEAMPKKEKAENSFLTDNININKFKYHNSKKVPKRLFGFLFSKKKKPNVSEIKDIFSEIESSLKE